MFQPALVVLAAGVGSRYGGLKQMEWVDGRGHILADYSIFDAISVGFEKIVFIIRKEMEAELSALIKSRNWYKKVEVQFAFQELDMLPVGFLVPQSRTKPWGTAHAVACLKGKINSPFAIINADDFYGREAIDRIYGFLESNKESFSYAMVGYKLKNTLSKNGSVSRGICRSEGEFLKEITEKAGIGYIGAEISCSDGEILMPNTTVSMNLWGFTPDAISECEERFVNFLERSYDKNPQTCEFYLPSVVSELIKEGKATVKLMETKEKWYGITYKKDRKELAMALEKMKEKGLYPEKM